MKFISLLFLIVSSSLFANQPIDPNMILDDETLEYLRQGNHLESHTQALNQIENFSDVWDYYPSYFKTSESVKKMIGGGVNVNWITNTCVVRTSRALNYSSNELSRHEFQKYGRRNGKKGLVVRGGDGNWYALRVTEMSLYLKKKYFAPIHYRKPSKVIKKLKQTKSGKFRENRRASNFIKDQLIHNNFSGIIMYNVPIFQTATGHFDIIKDGSRIKGHGRLEEASEVFIWPVNY
jgi:hypothetical protein